MASRLARTSSSVVAQDETLIRIATCPCHSVPPHQQVPSRCTRSMTARVTLGRTERHQHLVQDDIVQDVVAAFAQPARERLRMAAGPFDQAREAVAPERAQRCPELDAARPARHLGENCDGSRCSPGTKYAETFAIAARSAAASRTSAMPQS